jgi:hypothetical protein
MSDALTTYLHDHLAGSVLAIDLLDALAGEHAGEPLAEFAAVLRVEIDADRELLRSLTERVGTRSNPLKEATAWIAEKVSRLKLGRSAAGDLGTFEALEALALGILGKLALWRALARVAGRDERLAGVDYEILISRAVAQHSSVEQWRLELAQRALLAEAPAAAEPSDASGRYEAHPPAR